MDRRVRHWLRLLLVAGASLAIATLTVAVLEHSFEVANASSAYLVAVVLGALLVGTDAAVVIAVGAFLDPGVLLSVVLLLFVGVAVGRLAALQRERWERQVPGVPLVVVESPYRALTGPLMAYLDVLKMAWPPDKPEPITFVVIPEYVARHWWERALYNQSARRLRSVLLGRPNTVVVGVPYRRDDPVDDAA